MFRCTSIEQVKQAAVLFALLTFSMAVQAEPEAVTDSGSHAAKADSELESKVADLQQNVKFPRWSERRLANREMIPPPPPGPYISSALRDFSVKGLSFGRDPDNYEANNSVPMFDSSTIPMDMFSPDRPWPENIRSENTRLPNRAMPGNSYNYVNPRVTKKTYPVLQNRMPFMGNYGYSVPGNTSSNNVPARAFWPNTNVSVTRRMPSTGVDSRGQGMNNYGVRR